MILVGIPTEEGNVVAFLGITHKDVREGQSGKLIDMVDLGAFFEAGQALPRYLQIAFVGDDQELIDQLGEYVNVETMVKLDAKVDRSEDDD